jgi:hypothetical protein
MSSQKTTLKAAKDVGKFKSGKRLMIDVADFNVTKWSNTEIDFEDEKTKNSNQFTCYGRYNYGKESSPVQNQLVFKTGAIKLVTYGIPQLGTYAKTDKDRCYIKVPYDTSQDSCVQLFKMFQSLDAWAVKNKDKFFTGKLSKFAKMYDYTPIVRKPQEAISMDDEEGEAKPKSDKPMYAKIKINTDWQSGDVTTTVFVREDGSPVKQEVNTVTDMATLVTWQSTVQMICAANKLWFGKSADKAGRRQYGIAFKLLQCEVTEKVGGSSTKSDFTTYAFDDTVKVEEKEESKVVAAESDSESEDEQPVKQAVKATADSDSEDEQPVKQPVKQTIKATADSDSDEESEDEKPAKKPVAKASAKKPADSDSDEESEDEKPAPKVTAKKPAKSGR